MLTNKRLLRFTRELLRSDTFSEVFDACQRELQMLMGYQTVWAFFFEDDMKHARLLQSSGQIHAEVWKAAPVLAIDGDPFLEEIRDARDPIVVVDALTDPRTDKEQVALLQNRTIVGIPMQLVDSPMGVLGTGTFGEEGPRPPSDEELDYLMRLAAQVAVAMARIRLTVEREQRDTERREMERMIARRQSLESLGLLAGGVAHDFNNLLTVITCSTELLERGIHDTNGRLNLHLIGTATERAAGLARQLLSINHEQPLTPALIDVNECLQRMCSLLERVIPATIEIRLTLDPTVPNIVADASQLDQLVLNLCVNARDAMPAGGMIRLETGVIDADPPYVERHPWASTGRYVTVTITDDGCGMSAEVRERVFEPFFTTKKAMGGSGLGLAIAHGVARRHDGMLTCQSDEGVGTTFQLLLPADNMSETPARPDDKPVAGGPERILVADDQEHILLVVRQTLERVGYTVATAANGAEAIARSQEGSFDLLLLDAVMPDMSGRQVHEHVIQSRPQQKFLFFSGYGASAVPAQFLADLGVELLPKPFSSDALMRAVRRTLDRPPVTS